MLPINPNIYNGTYELITIYFYWPLYNYAIHVNGIVTPTTAVQGVDNHG